MININDIFKVISSEEFYITLTNIHSTWGFVFDADLFN